MRRPDEVAAMLRLKALGWGVRRIAAAFGCSHVTVRRYLTAGGWVEYPPPRRAKALDGLEGWLAERFRQHRGNADVVRQDLVREHGIAVSLRTVERAVAPLRQALRAEARATVRFETPPGRQLQIDFVSRRYERGSMLITSNRSVGEWGTVFGDPVVATAILDRLLHHATVVNIKGLSYRMRAHVPSAREGAAMLG
jgi:hypothetical protein